MDTLGYRSLDDESRTRPPKEFALEPAKLVSIVLDVVVLSDLAYLVVEKNSTHVLTSNVIYAKLRRATTHRE